MNFFRIIVEREIIKNLKNIEIMDTTLRDGEQTDGVSFSSFEKLQLSRFFLEKLAVDRIEIASARVSKEEHETVKEILTWAKQQNYLDRIEILGFVDGQRSVDWIASAGGCVLNLLTKGSQKHCEIQLGQSLGEHLSKIQQTIEAAIASGLTVQLYLEDWSHGFLDSPKYLEEMLKELIQMQIKRLFLPDTMGILSPNELKLALRHAIKHNPKIPIDFHGHNDYGLAVANCLVAVQEGVSALHVSINGLGERAGNSPLEAVVTALHDKLGIKTSINEKAITDASRLVETFSAKRIQSNRPIVGQDVYTQTAGIHADGDQKANLYSNPILPERFGRQRVYALGKLAGKASISKNLEMLGIKLSVADEKSLLNRIKELGAKKKIVTPDELPYIIGDLFGLSLERAFKISACVIRTSLKGRASAEIEIEYKGKVYPEQAEGDGGYNAFMNAIAKMAEKVKIKLPELIDYEVHIPPGGKSDALVEAMVTWQGNFRTSGFATDQVLAAVHATEKMLNKLHAPNHHSLSKTQKIQKLIGGS